VIGIPASVRMLEFDMPFHGTAQQYLRAVREHVGATVLTIPGLEADNAIELLDQLDGVLLTGSFSNIHPSTYGEPVRSPAGFYDPPRDAVTIPLIRAAVARGLPIFGICRGMQELNVAFGGTLYQALQEEPGKKDHRPDEDLPLPEQFGPAHEIEILPGGVLASLISEPRIAVSTAHMQGVDRVAPGLRVEALAEDGVVEALSVERSEAFALGVQFHPEWDVAGNRLYGALFAAFRSAVWGRAARRGIRADHRHAARPGGAAGT
jgi:putative glutamine amidotransferase